MLSDNDQSHSSGNLYAQKISLNGENANDDGDIVTNGNIKTVGGDVYAQNFISGGFIKANTLRLGSLTDIPILSGEVAANHITVNDGGNERIKLDGHNAKIIAEKCYESCPRVVIDGSQGLISLEDRKGQNLTLTVDNILQQVTLQDLTVQGDQAFLEVKEGSGANDDYIKIDARGPILKMINQQGLGETHSVHMSAVDSKIEITDQDNEIALSAAPPTLKLQNHEQKATNIAKLTIKDSARGNKPSFILTKEKQDIFVMDTFNENFQINSYENPNNIMKLNSKNSEIKIENNLSNQKFISVSLIKEDNDDPTLKIKNLKYLTSIKSNSIKIMKSNRTLFSIKASQDFQNITRTSLEISDDNLHQTQLSGHNSLTMLYNKSKTLEINKNSIELINSKFLLKLDPQSIKIKNDKNENLFYFNAENSALLSIGKLKNRIELNGDEGVLNIWKTKNEKFCIINQSDNSLKILGQNNELELNSEKGLFKIHNTKNNYDSVLINTNGIKLQNENNIFSEYKTDGSFSLRNFTTEIIQASVSNKQIKITDGSESFIILNGNGLVEVQQNSQINAKIVNGQLELNNIKENEALKLSSNSISAAKNNKKVFDVSANEILSTLKLNSLNGKDGLTAMSNGNINIYTNNETFLEINSNKKELKVKTDESSVIVSSSGSIKLSSHFFNKTNQISILSNDENRNNKPSILIEKNNEKIFEINADKEELTFSPNIETSKQKISMSSQTSTIKVENGDLNSATITPSAIIVGVEQPLVLSTLSVQIENQEDKTNSVCLYKGQLIIGTGLCKGHAMMTAV